MTDLIDLDAIEQACEDAGPAWENADIIATPDVSPYIAYLDPSTVRALVAAVRAGLRIVQEADRDTNEPPTEEMWAQWADAFLALRAALALFKKEGE